MRTRMLADYDEPDRVMVAGDWHGTLFYARSVVSVAHLKGITHILHVGDFGIWPAKDGSSLFLDGLHDLCRQLGIVIWFIDGNHENFDWLLSREVGENGLRMVREGTIYHIPRGSVWDWKGQRWMGLGGATSLDKPRRTTGVSWWPQEELTQLDIDTALAAKKVDVMLTHDCPEGVSIPGINHHSDALWPEVELKIAKAHQARLGAVVQQLRPSLLIHGHFHINHQSILKYGDGSGCHVIGLDCDQNLQLDQNYVVVDL